jgi:hypothetical protein
MNIQINVVTASDAIATAKERGEPPPPVDFMWENTPTTDRRALRDCATVYSHISNGKLLEDKWALALLQVLFNNFNLFNHVIHGSS